MITLGLPDSLTALVWVAAPLCGVIVQPYVGIASDQCQFRWGRRRPFILFGAVGTIVSILGLAASRTFGNCVIDLIGGDIHSNGSVVFRIMVAISWLYSLNFFIQPLQGGVRALIIDICPATQQATASAYASLMTGLGNILGYLFGFISIKDHIGFEDITQFAFLSIFAALTVALTVTMTCCFVREEVPSSFTPPQIEGQSVISRIKHIFWSIKTMPSAIQKVCIIQFFAWMGWFPFLFYISSFVGNICKTAICFFRYWLLTHVDAAPRLSAEPDMSAQNQALVIEDAVRSGSRASLCFAIVAFLTNALLPRLIPSRTTNRASSKSSRWSISMTRAWSASHFLFAFLMFCTVFVSSIGGATAIVATVGLSWAFTLWVPFTIIGEEVAARRLQNTKVMEGDLQPTQQDQAGAIMGLHNCAISAPQIVAALACSLVFWMTRTLGVEDGIGWVLRFGACGSLVAGWLADRLKY